MRLQLRNPPGTRSHWLFVDPPPFTPSPDASPEQRRHMANRRRGKQIKVNFVNGFTDVEDPAVIKHLVDNGLCWRPAEAA